MKKLAVALALIGCSNLTLAYGDEYVSCPMPAPGRNAEFYEYQIIMGGAAYCAYKKNAFYPLINPHTGKAWEDVEPGLGEWRSEGKRYICNIRDEDPSSCSVKVRHFRH